MFDSHLSRFEFDGRVEHKDGQQFVYGKGFAADAFDRVHRIEPHGFASNPVKGGIAVAMSARGNRDAAYVFGGENPRLRPEVPMGGVAIYDYLGNIASIVQQHIRIVHSDTIHLIAPLIILEGAVKLGGPGASRPLSAQGTVDSNGDQDTSNFSTSAMTT